MPIKSWIDTIEEQAAQEAQSKALGSQEQDDFVLELGVARMHYRTIINYHHYRAVPEPLIATTTQNGTARNRRTGKRCRFTEEEEDEDETDPLEAFGGDIMLKILQNLKARSVAPTLLVSRAWNGVASSDTLWTPKEFVFSAELRFLLIF
ncbi:hypothetical protein WN943_029365 [Citrus x changshan-huyou]